METRPQGWTPALVDDPTQCLEQRRGTMDLIDDDELAGLSPQKGVGIPQAALIHWPLKIKVERCIPGPASCNAARESGLADLARAEQDDGRHLLQAVFHIPTQAASDHD